MTRKKAISLLVFLVLIAGAIGTYTLLPKRYSLGERLNQTDIFWNDHEAFLFLSVTTSGQSGNFLHDKLAATRYGYMAYFLGGASQFFEQNLVAYRLLPSGDLQRVPLPRDSATFGTWTLQDGQLQLTSRGSGMNAHNGFRWDGKKFVVVPQNAKPQLQTDGNPRLSPDDADEDDGETGFLTPAARKLFKNAHWHYKQLTGFGTKDLQATLPIQLGGASFELTVISFPPPEERTTRFDLLAFGMKSLALSKAGQEPSNQVLWSQKGWQPISRSDFEERAQRAGHTASAPLAVWGWLVFLFVVMFSKFGSWLQLFLSLIGTKRRVLNSMATAYSFPPATPSQFPLLDLAALDRYTQDFESMGFVRLLDFSLVSNAPNPIPNFCRLFVHTRNHCFGEVSQLFPPRKSPMPLKCSIQSVLQDGWTLAFSDRKPQAASPLLRREKALAICMPAATTSELLQSFLKMRDQVCQDLGISPMREDTLEAYIAKTQRTVTDMREAVQQKNFASGLTHYYFRKFSLLRTREEYSWLGDYPKEAERRKQGFAYEARAL